MQLFYRCFFFSSLSSIHIRILDVIFLLVEYKIAQMYQTQIGTREKEKENINGKRSQLLGNK